MKQIVSSDMLAAGEIDALYGPEPRSYRASAQIVRLFENYREVELDYHRRTGHFPIMHTIVIRQEIVDEHPWVVTSLLHAFTESKVAARADLDEIGAVKHMLPWLPAHADETQQAFGVHDWWPLGAPLAGPSWLSD